MAKNNGKSGKSGVVAPVVVVGQVIVDAPVMKVLCKQDSPERIGVLLDVGGGQWGRLRVSEFPSFERPVRDEMLEAIELSDPITVKVTEVRKDGNRTLIELSALAVVKDEQAAAAKAQQADGEAALARLVPGYRVLGTVTKVATFGVFVAVDPFHTGLLHRDEQLSAKQRPNDLKDGDTVEVEVLSVGEPAGRNTRVSLSEKKAVASRQQEAEKAKAQAKVVAGEALKGSLVVGQTYKALTVSDDGDGLTVAIDGLVMAKLANRDMLGAVIEGDKVTVKTRASFAAPRQPLTVEVVSVDGPVVVVKQTSKKKAAKS